MSKISPEIPLPFISLDRTVSMPLYRQLYEGIRNSIFSGMLKQGERMPSTRTWAEELSVSRNCVMQAFDQLLLEGFLEGRAGDGTYVCKQLPELPKRPGADPGAVVVLPEQVAAPPEIRTQYWLPRDVMERDSETETFVPFQLCVPSLDAFPFSTWSKISSAVYRDIQLLHLGYNDAQGYLPLREALVDYLRINRSIRCTAEQIVIVNGSRQALQLAMQVLLSAGDECWMEDPGYNAVKTAITQRGAKLCPVPVTAQGIDITYASTHYPKAKLAYVTPSHQYPLGGTLPLSERLRLLQWAAVNRMWIIEDDYDSEFRYNGRPIPALQGLDTNGNVIYVGTFSKVLFPALRLAYLVLPTPEVARHFKIAKAVADRHSPLIEQRVLSTFITEGHFERHMRRMRVLYKKQQDTLIRLLQLHLSHEVTIAAADAGMHLVVWLLRDIPDTVMVQAAAVRRLIVFPVTEFVVQFPQRPGLLLGFTGFTDEQLEQSVLCLKQVFADITS